MRKITRVDSSNVKDILFSAVMLMCWWDWRCKSWLICLVKHETKFCTRYQSKMISHTLKKTGSIWKWIRMAWYLQTISGLGSSAFKILLFIFEIWARERHCNAVEESECSLQCTVYTLYRKSKTPIWLSNIG